MTCRDPCQKSSQRITSFWKLQHCVSACTCQSAGGRFQEPISLTVKFRKHHCICNQHTLDVAARVPTLQLLAPSVLLESMVHLQSIVIRTRILPTVRSNTDLQRGWTLPEDTCSQSVVEVPAKTLGCKRLNSPGQSPSAIRHMQDLCNSGRRKSDSCGEGSIAHPS